MPVRAKFVCNSIEDHGEFKTIHACPVFGSKDTENGQFFKWTPSGKLELQCCNPEAVKEFKPKQEFYIDFTQVIPEENQPVKTEEVNKAS